MDPKHLTPGDATLIENIVSYLKAKGIFDEFRHECLADVDTKSSCQNLSQRVDGYTSKYLANETWHPDLNKNELRNNLRQHILQSSFLAPGTDIVVEQVITAKLYNYFLPKIIEVVHGYVKEQSELLNKKPEPTTSTKSCLTSEKPVSDTAENKDKMQISDPIADILCFIHPKTESIQHKDGDTLKMEKTKEEKNIPSVQGEVIITPVNEAKVQPKKEKDKIKKEDSKIQQDNLKKIPDIQGDIISISINEAKMPIEKDKEKIKKEDPKIQQEVLKKIVKEEIKSEKKKIDDVKISVSEISTMSEENKSNVLIPSKFNISSKKDDKNKHKSKSQNVQKSSNSSNEIKKSKKDLSEKPYDKLHKSKSTKSAKESHSPTKLSNSQKSVFKEECSKTKSHDVGSNKIPESLGKKSKSSCDKKDSNSSKHKGYNEKTDKPKISKLIDKNEPHIHHDSSNSEKGSKHIQYSSSYDSSQGSDQEKNTSTNSRKERTKHFSKHANTEKSELPNNSSKIDKKRSNSEDESSSKKYRNEKDIKLKSKDISVIEAAKICSRSNSFGSTSSIGSSSNASKDNLISNSDEASENSVKDKKKKQLKEKDSCQSSPKTLPPPPPPPPPPSSSLTSELTSSAEMSSMEEDTQSSMDDSETSSSEEISEESSSESELESKDLINDTLNENTLNSSNDNINAFYDIFLYSSSSSEFEGYGNSPEKKNVLENIFENMHESDLSISSVHTSDLSSFEDELSSDDEVAILTGGLKKRLTLKEAQELIKNKAVLNEKKKAESKSHVGEDLINKRCSERSSSFVSSDDESPPSEPKRSLRRERKLNPRYSSSEYTSIFNCKKETFITKQTSPVKSQTFSPKIESKLRKAYSFAENNKLIKESLKEAKNIEIASSNEIEILEKNEIKFKKELKDEDDNSKMSSSDELDSFMDKEKLFKENNKNNLISDNDKLKDEKKLKPYNNSKSRKNSHSLKRKLEVTESTPVKRPCSRSSVDSSSSEFTPNENKPFNSEKNDFHDEKKFNDCNLKVSNLTIGVKKDIFCKQKANNNGDILGQKNSHSKAINNSEKKDK